MFQAVCRVVVPALFRVGTAAASGLTCNGFNYPPGLLTSSNGGVGFAFL
jgi:hypothetical protein